MAETDFHRVVMMCVIRLLTMRYADDPNVYVSGNILLFYEEGNKRKHLSPDALVVFGVHKEMRNYYLLWKEGKAPDVVIEITSSSTRREDLNKKFVLYRDTLKVKEYILFDPFGDYLKPALQGYRLIEGEYVPMELNAGRLTSELLGLQFEPKGWNLRLIDVATGEELRLPEDELDDNRAALKAAELELEQLRRQVAEMQKKEGKNGK
jgi:Uma2 family endonuclease